MADEKMTTEDVTDIIHDMFMGTVENHPVQEKIKDYGTCGPNEMYITLENGQRFIAIIEEIKD